MHSISESDSEMNCWIREVCQVLKMSQNEYSLGMPREKVYTHCSRLLDIVIGSVLVSMLMLISLEVK